MIRLLPVYSPSHYFIGIFDSLTDCAVELLIDVIIRNTFLFLFWLCVKVSKYIILNF